MRCNCQLDIPWQVKTVMKQLEEDFAYTAGSSMREVIPFAAFESVRVKPAYSPCF